MKVQNVKMALRVQEWAMQERQRIESGQSVREWSMVRGITSKAYYYRLNRVREELLAAGESTAALRVPNAHGALATADTPVFAALPVERTGCAAVTVRQGEYSIEIRNGTDKETIENVLTVLSRL
jgi:hypothetical protein